MAPRDPFPFRLVLSSGGYIVSGVTPRQFLDVYRRDNWCGTIKLDGGQVAEISLRVPKYADPFPREEAVKALRRILGTTDEASQITEPGPG